VRESEDKIGELEDTIGELEDRMWELEDRVRELEDGIGESQDSNRELRAGIGDLEHRERVSESQHPNAEAKPLPLGQERPDRYPRPEIHIRAPRPDTAIPCRRAARNGGLLPLPVLPG